MIVVAIVDLIAIGSDYAEYRLLGTDYTLEQADANDLRQGVIGVAQFALLVVTAVLREADRRGSLGRAVGPAGSGYLVAARRSALVVRTTIAAC